MRRIHFYIVLEQRQETFLDHFGKRGVEAKVIKVFVSQELLIPSLLFLLKSCIAV